MYTPHTVTICNEVPEGMTTVTYSVILSGVFLSTTRSNPVNNTGANSGDSVTLFVPFSVNATAPDGSRAVYVKPKEYAAMDDKAGYWTLQSAGDASAVGTFIIKGEAGPVDGYSAAKKQYDDVFRVSSVRTLDYGSEDMQHWQVTAT